jgi:hypothetical protein
MTMHAKRLARKLQTPTTIACIYEPHARKKKKNLHAMYVRKKIFRDLSLELRPK